MMKEYQAELTDKKRQEDELKLIKVPTRRMTKVINDEIPDAIRERSNDCMDAIQCMKRYIWRKNYELMMPVLLLGPGKSFGELAMQKEKSKKIERDKTRLATVLCRTDCKFAVMKKADYQNVLMNLELRRIERLKEFFK